ncbi:tetratricopeptide repeat protein [Actinomycetes bacterium KLBMP 9759]
MVISAIDGMAGVGKTALAIHAAHRMSGRFPDGQLFIDLHGHTDGVPPVDAGVALDRVLRSMGVPGAQIPEHLEDRAALYRSLLAGRKVLVVLDNAASEAQVAPLVPGTPGCLVLVTSRRRLTGLDRTRTVSLDVLSQPDAIALFRRIAGEERLAGAAPDAVAEVVELCGRLPLAIRIAAARLRSRPTWTVQHLAEGLVDHRQGLTVPGGEHRSVAAALDLSFRQLDPDLQRAYRLLGLHPGTDFDPDAAVALVGAPPSRTRRLVDDLIEANLLQELVPGRCRFHDLVRAHAGAAAARADAGPEAAHALTRLLDHYRDMADMAMDVAYPTAPASHRAGHTFPDPDSAIAWLEVELPNLRSAAMHAAGQVWPRHAVRLAVTLHRHLHSQGPFSDAEQLYLRVLESARDNNDLAGQAEVLVCLGDIRWPQGRVESAMQCYRRAVGIARDLDLSAVELRGLTGLADLERMRDEPGQAVGFLDTALDIARRSGDRSGEVAALITLGWAELDKGQPAVDHFEEAMTIARAIGNRHETARALRGLGHVHRLQGRRARAIEMFEQALVMARAIGGRSAEFGALIGIGMIHRLEGRYQQAGPPFERALALAVEIGDINSQFEAHQGMGRLHLSAGNADRAVACHRAALDAAITLNQPADQVRAHDGLAHAYLARNQPELARRHWQTAAAILARQGVETTHDEEATAAAIHARLRQLPPLT